MARVDETRIGNVVLMGMGEPMQNIEEVLGFCRLANDPEGFGLGARNIAISTAGWVPGIDRLAAEPLQVKLALSLHAPNDNLRSQLMPVNRRYGLDELMAACRRYREATRRRIFVEYLMLDGVNDWPALADELADLLHGTAPGGFHVNLIVYNPTDSDFRASPEPVIQRFLDRLEARKVPASVRRSKGTDIAAACGQLAVQGARERRAEVMRERRASATVGPASR
jgi:23S rRNA (adenine2503-C2)-methyltransferase